MPIGIYGKDKLPPLSSVVGFPFNCTPSSPLSNSSFNSLNMLKDASHVVEVKFYVA